MLRLHGWQILARDFRTPVGEIDLIARRRGTIAFIEVKARAKDGSTEALTPRQRRRIVRAAEVFLGAYPHLLRLEARFDLMLVARRRLPRHLPAAFRADD